MADRAQGAISFTPVVTIAADSDADAVDAIHHNIKGSLGGDLTYTASDAADVWYYAPNVIVTSTSEELFGASDNATDLVGATGDQVNGPNEAAGQPVDFTHGTAADCDADKVYFLFIKNTGTSDTSGTTTTNSVYVSLDTTAAAYNALDNIEIKAGEAWMSNINGPLMASIFVISAQARGAATAATVNSSTSVRCTVAAIVDDVSV
jgi:hypothetical protein|tara:strand:- start:58 stop:675 length:618 start_codon:yes stop_codon:yes gene_type:complete